MVKSFPYYPESQISILISMAPTISLKFQISIHLILLFTMIISDLQIYQRLYICQRIEQMLRLFKIEGENLNFLVVQKSEVMGVWGMKMLANNLKEFFSRLFRKTNFLYYFFDKLCLYVLFPNNFIFGFQNQSIPLKQLTTHQYQFTVQS